VAVEICPTSYPPFGVHSLATIPLRAFLSAGVPVALSTDDPLLFGVGLAGQYDICRRELGLTDNELALIAAGGIASSAAPDDLKKSLLAEVEEWVTGQDK
jgi:adenosine deaminase